MNNYINLFGIKVINDGKKVTNSTTNNMAKANTQIIFPTFFKGKLFTPQVVNSKIPTGGVIPPSARHNIIIRAKCNGSKPNLDAIGTSAGTNIIIAARPSKNMPTIRNPSIINK